YRRHATGVRRYHTLCGAVEVRRDSYRRVGVHNGPTVVPLEVAAGIVENATPALAASVLEGFAMMPLRDYEGEMRAAHRVVPSRTSRTTHQRFAMRPRASGGSDRQRGHRRRVQVRDRGAVQALRTALVRTRSVRLLASAHDAPESAVGSELPALPPTAPRMPRSALAGSGGDPDPNRNK